MQGMVYRTPIESASTPIWKSSASRGRWAMKATMEWRRAVVRAAAREIIADNGLEGLHMRELAGRSGMSVQTLYNNFGSRDAILLSAIEEHTVAHLARAWQEATETRTHPIFATCDLTARMVMADFRFMQKLLCVLGQSDEGNPVFSAVVNHSAQSHLRAMRLTHQANCLRPWVDCEVATRHLQMIVISMLGELVAASEDDAARAKAGYEFRVAVGTHLLGLTCGADATRLERCLSDLSRTAG